MARAPEWMYRQSAVVAHRDGPSGPELLLVTSRKGKRWVLPKGVVEPGLTPAASAVKEALEEAGIRGRVHEPAIGTYRYRKWGGTCTVDVFAMRVTEVLTTWPEAGSRRREWLGLDAARQRIDEADLRQILDRHFT